MRVRVYKKDNGLRDVFVQATRKGEGVTRAIRDIPRDQVKAAIKQLTGEMNQLLERYRAARPPDTP